MMAAAVQGLVSSSGNLRSPVRMIGLASGTSSLGRGSEI